MKQLIGIACGLLILLPIVACNLDDEIVSLNPLDPDESLEKISAEDRTSGQEAADRAGGLEVADGAGGQGKVLGKPVSTGDVLPPEDINGEKPKEVPIGMEEDINQLKEQPPGPFEGDVQEDKAED